MISPCVADSIDVDDLMEQIRARLREKRGVDYTAEEIRELAGVRLERFINPRAVRSDLMASYREARRPLPIVSGSIFAARRPLIGRLRTLLHPVLRLFFNPDPIVEMITCVNDISNTMTARSDLYFELLNNTVLELTRTSIEVKNLQMRVDSLSGRLEFSERRARALEALLQMDDTPLDEQDDPADDDRSEGPGTRSRRRRARRARGRGESAASGVTRAAETRPEGGVDDPGEGGSAVRPTN